MVIIGEEVEVVFIYTAICLREEESTQFYFSFRERNLNMFIIFIFKCCSYGYQERNSGPDGSVSTCSSVFNFSFIFLMLFYLLDALSYMRDRIVSYRYLKGLNMKEELG